MSKKVFGGVICNLVICAVITIVFISSLGGAQVASGGEVIYRGNAKDKVSIMINVIGVTNICRKCWTYWMSAA